MRTWKRADRDGVYYVQIPGQGGWVSSGQTSKPRAIAWALAKATGGATADVTLGVYAKEFFLPGSCPRIRLLEEAGERNVSKSWQNVRQVLDAFILPRWGKTMLVTIRPKAFFEWLASPELTTSKEFDGKVRPLSAGQRNRIHSAMNHIFAQAAFDGLLETNPLDSIPWIKKRGAGRGSFSVAELALLFPADDAELVRIWGTLKWAVFFLVVYDSALRPGEALALRWRDWHPAHRAFVVGRGVDNLGRIGPIKTARKGVAKKVGLVGERAATLLGRLRAPLEPGDDDLVFPASRFRHNAGSTMRTMAASDHFIKSLARAGVPRVRPGVEELPRTQYCLRHTRNTELRTERGDESARLLMGHTPGSSMTDHYDHPEDADLILRALRSAGR